MNDISTYHWYTKAEIDEMLKSPKLASVQLRGYYLETDGARFRFIHDRHAFGKRRNVPITVPVNMDDIEPIKKRTGQQRTDSLTSTIIEDCKRAGSVPGFSDQKMTDLLGYKWVNGISVMTDEVARTIAATYLSLAEAKRNEQESHYVIRPSNYK